MRDFGTLLQRLGAVTVTDTVTSDVGGESRQINTYSYAGTVESSPPEQLSFLSEIENRFVRATEALADDLRRFFNLYRTLRGEARLEALRVEEAWVEGEKLGGWGVSVLGAVPDALRIYRGLTRARPPDVFARDTIEQMTQQIEGARQLIPDNDVMLMTNMVAETLGWTLGSVATDATLFGEDLEPIREALLAQTEPTVVFLPDYSRQLAVMRSPDASLVDTVRGRLTRRAQSHRVLVMTRDRNRYRRRSRAIRAVDVTQGDDEANLAAMTWLREWSEMP